MTMPYCTGQTPLVGDAVSDEDRRVGTVTHIIHYGGGPAELVIEWEDGTVGIRYCDHEALMLVQRRSVSANA
jgi:hypothetical protein